jgi:hypothetical protein
VVRALDLDADAGQRDGHRVTQVAVVVVRRDRK